VKFRLRHGSFQPQEQTIVEVLEIIDPVGIHDKRFRQAAKLEQALEVRGIARQARNFQPENRPSLVQTNLVHQILEALPPSGAAPRNALVGIDDQDPFRVPSK
jgi:hypothetical protein